MPVQKQHLKIIHTGLLIVGVLAFNLAWRMIAAGNIVQPFREIFLTPHIIEFGFYILLQSLAVGIILKVWMPRFLDSRKLLAYVLAFSGTAGIAAALIVPGYYLTAAINGQSVQQLYGVETCWYHFLGRTLASTISLCALFMSGALTMQNIRNKKREQLLEKEKLETELKFLRSQFNPHFLFNSINSIFFLIDSDPAAASKSLASFSELLRYQLYECNDARIHLNKEINYLTNFINLEKLRQNSNMQVDCQIPSYVPDHIYIAPFILMPFIENAFKHVSKNTDDTNFIRITMGVEQEQLTFQVENSVAAQTAIIKKDSGIGLANVQRRLDLIYPGKYQLDIRRETETFIVTLRLNCREGAIIKSISHTA